MSAIMYDPLLESLLNDEKNFTQTEPEYLVVEARVNLVWLPRARS